MEKLTQDLPAYLAAHPEMAIILIALTAFGESVAVISFLIPGSTILIAAGALVQAGSVDPWLACAAGASGALIGDTISYFLGRGFGRELPQHWPFRNHPETFARGETFFRRYGWPSLFVGRFLGPLRAFVALAAGMCHMTVATFYVTSVISALLWAPSLIYSGYLIGLVLQNDWSAHEKALAIAGAMAVVTGLAYAMRRIFKSE